MTGVLPVAPFPPLHWWRLAAAGAVVDGGEPFVKQSERSRLRLAGARGATSMPWDVVHSGGTGSTAGMRLSDHTPPRVRWRMLVTDYGTAPFFEHIAPELEPIFRSPPDTLGELARWSWDWVCEWTGWAVPAVTDAALPWDAERAAAGLDLRERQALRGKGWHFAPYPQVFSPATGFVERCSVLDALMHLGPDLGGQLDALVRSERA